MPPRHKKWLLFTLMYLGVTIAMFGATIGSAVLLYVIGKFVLG